MSYHAAMNSLYRSLMNNLMKSLTLVISFNLYNNPMRLRINAVTDEEIADEKWSISYASGNTAKVGTRLVLCHGLYFTWNIMIFSKVLQPNMQIRQL